MLTDEIKGKPLDEISHLGQQDVLDNLGIEISPARLKCAMLSLDTLRSRWPGPRRVGTEQLTMPDGPRVREVSPDRGAATDRRRARPSRHARSCTSGRPATSPARRSCRRSRSPTRIEPGRARTRQSRSSSTAPPAPARCAPRSSSSSMGYQDVSSMAGGIGRWKAEGRPWELPDGHASQ